SIKPCVKLSPLCITMRCNKSETDRWGLTKSSTTITTAAPTSAPVSEK
nr:envelope glycoprotein gp130 {clone Y6} [simian immunodeficiency virus SIVmac, isolate 251, Peptide Recombinant Partial, 47 aa] [Simian immunodeficiency virus - mac]